MNQANRKTDGSTGWGGVCPGTFFLFLVEGKVKKIEFKEVGGKKKGGGGGGGDGV